MLWRDDLAEIVAVIREYESNVTMSITDYELDDVEDLANLQAPRVDNFVLDTESERIRLSLGRNNALLEVHSTDLATRGVAAEIERIAKTKRRLAYRFRVLIVAALVLVAALGLTVGAFAPHTALRSALIFCSVLMIVPIILVTSAPLYRAPSGAILRTRTRAEAPPWLQRNRDALVTNAIVNAIFLAVGILIGYLLPRR